MKTRIKLILFGVAVATVALFAASQTVDPTPRQENAIEESPCYTNKEVELLAKANHWSETEARTILELACKYSSHHEKP